jgi:hypothetical protein
MCFAVNPIASARVSTFGCGLISNLRIGPQKNIKNQKDGNIEHPFRTVSLYLNYLPTEKFCSSSINF